jgi:hypothetical protein
MADTITKDIIFRIGSVVAPGAAQSVDSMSSGIGGMAAKIAGLTAGFYAAQKAISYMITEGNRFRNLVEQSTSDMSLLNSQTAGLIDTMGAYEGAARVAAAGTEATAGQLAAMGKAAIVFNRQIGGGPGGATEVF